MFVGINNIIRALTIFLLVAGVSPVVRAEDKIPPQFGVWGSAVPESVDLAALPEGMSLVLPSNADFGPQIQLSEDDLAAGFLPYSCRPLSFMHPQLRPAAAQRISPTISGFATLGEYEPLALGIYAATHVKNLRISMEPLVNGNREAFPAACIDIRRVRFMPNQRSATQAVLEPLLLDKPSAIEIEQGQSSFVWITLYVPVNTPAGIYRGNLRLEADGLPAQRVPVVFRVFPFQLVETERWLGMLYGFGWGGDWIRGNPHHLEDELIDMREHGMNHLAYSQQRPSFTGDPESGFTFDFDVPAKGDKLSIGRVIDEAVRLGLDKAYFTHIHGPEHSKSWICGYEWATPEADQWFTAYYRAWSEEAKERNWPPIIHNIADEPQIRSGTLPRARHLAELVKAGDPANMTSAFLMGNLHYGEDDIAAFGDTLDMYITFVGNGEYQKRLRESGKKIMLYNHANPNRPLECRQAYGFTLINTGALGHQQFCYRLVNNPKKLNPVSACYNYLNPGATYHEPAWIYAFPGADGLLPNPAFEGIREGVDDLRYWETLQKILARVERSADPDSAAEAALQRRTFEAEIAGFAPLSEDGHYRGTGWMYHAGQESYDLLRFKMARAIAGWLAKDGTLLQRSPSGGQPESAAAVSRPSATPKPTAGENPDDTPATLVRGIEYRPVESERIFATTRQQALIAKLSQAPQIDGKGDDPVWAQAPENGGNFHILGNKSLAAPDFQSRFRLGSHGDTLYLLLHMSDGDALKKRADTAARPKHFVWNNDLAEIYLGSPANPGVVIHLAVNLWGDTVILGADYRPGMFLGDKPYAPVQSPHLAVAADDAGWTLEAAFPADFFGMRELSGEGAGWVCNIARVARTPQGAQLSSWAELGNSFNEPWRFGRAFATVVPPVFLEWVQREGRGDERMLIGYMNNPSGKEVTGVLSATVPEQPVRSREIVLQPGVNPFYIDIPDVYAACALRLAVNERTFALGGVPALPERAKQFMPGVGQQVQPELEGQGGILSGSPVATAGAMYSLTFSLPLAARTLCEQPVRARLLRADAQKQEEVSQQELTLQSGSGALLLELPGQPGKYLFELEIAGLRALHYLDITAGLED